MGGINISATGELEIERVNDILRVNFRDGMDVHYDNMLGERLQKLHRHNAYMFSNVRDILY